MTQLRPSVMPSSPEVKLFAFYTCRVDFLLPFSLPPFLKEERDLEFLDWLEKLGDIMFPCTTKFPWSFQFKVKGLL